MIWTLYRTLVGTAVLSGVVLAATYQATREPILTQQRDALSRAVFNVVPDATSYRAFHFDAEDGLVAADDDILSATCFTGSDASGRIVGHAITAAGMGYQDQITLIYGLGRRAQHITRVSVLANRETPGLGSKIATDVDFLTQFENLRLDREIEVVRTSRAAQPWQIDAITGATVSSRAVVRLINESAAQTSSGGQRLRSQLEALNP